MGKAIRYYCIPSVVECIHESGWMILNILGTPFDRFLDMLILRGQEELEDKLGIWNYLLTLYFRLRCSKPIYTMSK